MLAHPGQQNNFEILPELKRAGLWGIELKHPVHNAYWQKIVLQAAADYGLFCTAAATATEFILKNTTRLVPICALRQRPKNC